jgi:transposase
MKTSLELRYRIINLYLFGNSYRKILKILKSDYSQQLSYYGLYKIIQKFRNNKRLSGRKCKLGIKELEYLDEIISNNREISYFEIANKIKSKFNIQISKTTIKRSARKVKWIKKTTRFFLEFL